MIFLSDNIDNNYVNNNVSVLSNNFFLLFTQIFLAIIFFFPYLLLTFVLIFEGIFKFTFSFYIFSLNKGQHLIFCFHPFFSLPLSVLIKQLCQKRYSRILKLKRREVALKDGVLCWHNGNPLVAVHATELHMASLVEAVAEQEIFQRVVNGKNK